MSGSVEKMITRSLLVARGGVCSERAGSAALGASSTGWADSDPGRGASRIVSATGDLTRIIDFALVALAAVEGAPRRTRFSLTEGRGALALRFPGVLAFFVSR